ncbi:hypothetical protein [Burkholderia sp. MSMB2042]|uniref:hypothetical protein n=1 Tax=Burkholderia sp. MSMB2042 TaxID=1637840 RepID=UPI001E3109D0|nr:hypothetical protein [Burkholderia sp. MSMB2042]
MSKWTVRRRTVRKKSRDAAPAPLPMTLHGEQYSGQHRRRALGEAGRRRACARRLAPTRRVRGGVGRVAVAPARRRPGWDAARDASIRAKRRTPLIAHRSSLAASGRTASRSTREDARRTRLRTGMSHADSAASHQICASLHHRASSARAAKPGRFGAIPRRVSLRVGWHGTCLAIDGRFNDDSPRSIEYRSARRRAFWATASYASGHSRPGSQDAVFVW